MGYTVSDFYNTYSEHLEIVTGNGGFSREISSCATLDYELLPELKDKYFHSNFIPGQFIVSSLLFAKDNPYILTDAVKHLILKGASGLAIRNVLKLPLPKPALRYAEAKNFPVFLIRSVELPFERIIYTIIHEIEMEKSTDYHRHMIDRLLNGHMSQGETTEYALKLNPSFGNQFFCVFFQTDELHSDVEGEEFIKNYNNSYLFCPEDFICLFRQGVLFVKSGEHLTDYYNDGFLGKFMDAVFPETPVEHTGVSGMHNTLEEFGLALHEMLFAFSCQLSPEKKIRYFGELGSYKLIFPFCMTAEFVSFSNEIMKKIEEYDIENKTVLKETLAAYISSDERMDRAAKMLSQHEQTVRYRLKRIYSLTGLDPRSASDREQLSLACKISIAERLLRGTELEGR